MVALAFFGPFLSAILLSLLVRQKRMPGYVVPLMTAPFLVIYLLLIRWMPFRGAWTELVVGLFAALTLPWALAWMQSLKKGEWHPGVVAMGLLLVLVLLLMGERVTHAVKHSWTCDGPVVKKYRSHSHQALTIVVGDALGHRSFEDVDESLWNRADVDQRFVKWAGSETASLEGQTLRMLPLSLWSDDLPTRSR